MAAYAPVSALIPCYRCADTVGSAVASILGQRVRPAEVLLVDDGSGDGTRECLQELAREHAPGWIRVLGTGTNGGPSSARNLGWAHATQPWLAFLDADDTWHPHKLAVQMDVVAAAPSLTLLAHRVNVQQRHDPPPPQRYPLKVRAVRPHLLQWRTPFQTPSILLRREVPFRFDEQRRRAEDFLLWAQILLSGYPCAKIDQVLASLHKPAFGAGGLTADLPAMYAAGRLARRTLYEQRLVGWWHYRTADALASLRYARRRIIVRTMQRTWHEAQAPRATHGGAP